MILTPAKPHHLATLAANLRACDRDGPNGGSLRRAVFYGKNDVTRYERSSCLLAYFGLLWRTSK